MWRRVGVRQAAGCADAGPSSDRRGFARVEERIKGGTSTNVSRSNGPILERALGHRACSAWKLGGAAIERADAAAGI